MGNFMINSAFAENHRARVNHVDVVTLNVIIHYILFFIFKLKQNRET